MYLDSLLTNSKLFNIEKVEIRGITFYLKELNTEQKIEGYKLYGQDNIQNKSDTLFDYLLKLVYTSLCDENGNLTEDVNEFETFKKALPADVSQKLIDTMMKLNHMDNAGIEEIKNE